MSERSPFEIANHVLNNGRWAERKALQAWGVLPAFPAEYGRTTAGIACRTATKTGKCRLRTSGGTWFTCAKGYVYAADGSHSINDSTYALCTDVNDNVPFGVASLYDGFDSVTITH